MNNDPALEAAAKAIYEHQPERRSRQPFNALTPFAREFWLGVARLAIDAYQAAQSS